LHSKGTRGQFFYQVVFVKGIVNCEVTEIYLRHMPSLPKPAFKHAKQI